MTAEEIVAVGFMLVWAASEIADRLPLRRDRDESAVEAARREYVEGEIPLDEMERRIDRALDPRAQEIRERVEHVEHVGPETSAAVADHFDTIGEVETATTDDLEAVHGVGPSTARKIRDYF